LKVGTVFRPGAYVKETALVSLLVVILLASTGGAAKMDTRTLSGDFVWGPRGDTGALEAVFTAAGPGAWDVDFYFTFLQQAHVYSGTAVGELFAGDLTGEVLSDDQSRSFVFGGSFEDGVFRGTHSEVRGGEHKTTGSMTLGR
jgi:hypothetical protein